MTSERRKKPARQHRRRGRSPMGGGVGSKLLIMLAIVAAVILSIAVFFKVQTIEVKGNSVYGADAVIEASGIRTGSNLMAMNKSAAAGRIKTQLPYVEQVRIARILPDTVVLEVKESAAVFSVQDDTGAYWLMSFTGKILEPVNMVEAKRHPAMLGFTLKNPAAGEEAQSDDLENLQAAKVVLTALDGSGLADKITQVDVTKSFDIILNYGDQFRIKLGGTDQMAYKVKYLLAVLGQLSQYQTGTIDLTFEEEKVARFIPG